MPTLPTRADRRTAGEVARQRVPLSDHATWAPDADRSDPVVLIEEQARTRIPFLVPVRHGRMAISPFTFYRGAALPMAADLATLPRTGLTVQLSGDAHLSNFGLFASPGRDLVFDINDFDETLPGPFEWDVKRLAASIVVAGRSRGFPDRDCRHAAQGAVREYRRRTTEFASMRAIDVYYARVDAADILDRASGRSRHQVEHLVHVAGHHDALHELPKLTEVGPDGSRHIIDRPPFITHPESMTLPAVMEGLVGYSQTIQEDRRVLLSRYEFVDAALKVVGVGSVGLLAVAVLLDGGDGQDPLFIQFKQAEASVLERYLGASKHTHHGERVVVGQRRLQAASDILLGWTTGHEGRQLYVRQLQDQKAGAAIESMTLADLRDWGQICGWALARGHARSGDPLAIAGYLGGSDEFDRAVARFAVAYADQAEQDHAAFVAAIKDGRIRAA